jgi:FKBP-type peptidyl-prolyl cis-trans isomerase
LTAAVPNGMHAQAPAPAPAAVTTPPDVKAPPADAKMTLSGLAWKVLKAGTGTARPSSTSNVTVHYSGWTTDGKLFDSSVVRNEPATFPLNRVIRGWTEGVQLMVVGEKRRFWIPGALAYDNVQGPPGAPKGMLVFDIELLAIR